MCRLLFFTAVYLLSSSSFKAIAQDIIVKKNGEELKTKIVQVNDTLVKYKNFDDPEFVTFSMPSSEIKFIRFENGKKKIFGIDLAQSYISILGGISQPEGDYSSSNSYNSYSANAKTGRYTSIDGCLYLKNKKWGLGFDLTSFQNGFNSSEIDRTLRQNLYPNETVLTQYGKYSGGWLAVGPQYSSKLNRWITWDIRYSLGIMGITKPSMQYNYHDKNLTSVTYSSEAGGGISLVRTFSNGLRFHFSKRLAIKLFVQAAASNPVARFTTDFKQTDSTGSVVLSDHSPHKRRIYYNTVNTGICLTYQFGGERIKPDNRNMYGRFPKSYIGVIIGPSIPIASYANSSFSNNNSPGFAKEGGRINIEGCSYFKEKKWGIGFDLAMFRNQFDYYRIDQYLRNNYGSGFNGTGSNNPETVYTSYGNYYRGGWLAIGPQFSPRICRWIVWDLKASLGFIGLSKPSLNYTFYDSSGNRIEYDLSSGFGFGLVKTITTGFRFFLADRLAFRTFWQLAFSKPVVNYKASLTETNSMGNIILSDHSNRKKQVDFSTINLGFGLSYLFGK